jgi:hypothetical protein
MSPYKNQNQNQNLDTGSATNGFTAYHQNRIPADRDLHGWATNVRFRSNFRRVPSPPYTTSPFPA